jgi:signal transduction histidine kinase
MNNIFYLNWATMAISLFNTILLLWLGFTVFMNAERRNWGIYLASGGLLLGAAFFVSHTAIIGLTPAEVTWRNTIFWWTVGLIPAIMLPFTWYVIMLWYAGFWNIPRTTLRRRQLPWFYLTIAMAFTGLVSLGIGLILLAVPSHNLVELRLYIRYSFAGIPLLAIGYSTYVVLCVALSLDALRRPSPSSRIMGEQARARAHPWLTAASFSLLIVSFLVTGFMLWVVQDVSRRTFFEIYLESTRLIATLDLVIAFIIGIVIVLLGQAVVSYEVFTGKTLPRRGLLRHWQRVVLLALGYGIIIGGTLTLSVRPIYSLLLTTLLMTFFFALIGWRSYVERDRYIGNLRPFVTSHRLYEQLLTQSVPQDVDFVTPFHALCRDVLDAQVAYLAAIGPLAPLVGEPIVYPDFRKDTLPPLSDLASHFQTPNAFTLAINPDEYGGAIWAVALWSERGLIGLFLLGKKTSGSLYTQEEIEIARAVGERLIDTQASAVMSLRLMSLQRERLAQSQVIDQQTRRILHDDILPSLQTAMIALSGQPDQCNGSSNDAIAIMTDAHKLISDLLHNMPTVTVQDVARVGVITALKNVVDQELKPLFHSVNWHVSEEAVSCAYQIPITSAEVLYYAAREVIRNAARHGGGDMKQPLTLTITAAWQDGLILTIQDNGIGIGNSQQSKGSGQGLALHTTMMAVVGGAITINSVPKQYTQVRLMLPLTLNTQ